jgi:hypothetical protein
MNKNIPAKPQQKRTQSNQPKRPENKDNLDSRSGEEQLDKGDGTTHNKKDHHSKSKTAAGER